MPQEHKCLYEFDPFTLELAERIMLRRHGEEEPLTPIQSAVLAVLVRNHGNVVRKDALHRAVPRLETDQRLYECIHDLREILGKGRNQDCISVRAGKGYIFSAPQLRVSGERATDPTVVRLRSESPEPLSYDQAKLAVVEHDFYCAGWNEGGKGIRHRYERRANEGALVIVDHATGLMWQRGGDHFVSSPKETIQRLSTRKHAGFVDWRLPTLEEAMSLVTSREEALPTSQSLSPVAVRGTVVHLDPIFEKFGENRIWTADEGIGTPTFRFDDPTIQVPWYWVVNFWNGSCDIFILGSAADVKAVRSVQAAVFGRGNDPG